MQIVEYILIGLQALCSLAVIVVIMLQSGKEAGLGAISGSSDSYLSKNGGKLDQILAPATKWIALAWILLTLILSLI